MPSAAIIRHQIKASLSQRIPSALTPSRRIVRPVATTGLHSIDAGLEGGLPLEAITEVVGPECSGRTAFALSFMAGLTQSAKACVWVDVSDTLHPESAAASGVDLTQLLWVRCGVSATAYEESSSQQHAFSLPKKYLDPPPINSRCHDRRGARHVVSELYLRNCCREHCQCHQCSERRNQPAFSAAARRQQQMPPPSRTRKFA
jgi:recombination protein RecA